MPGNASSGHTVGRLPSASHPASPSLPGSFLEAASGSLEAVGLAAATLELVRCGPVQTHVEPFVRRAALLASAQVGAGGLRRMPGMGGGCGW